MQVLKELPLREVSVGGASMGEASMEVSMGGASMEALSSDGRASSSGWVVFLSIWAASPSGGASPSEGVSEERVVSTHFLAPPTKRQA